MSAGREAESGAFLRSGGERHGKRHAERDLRCEEQSVRGSKQPTVKAEFEQNYVAHAARKHSGIASIDRKIAEVSQPGVPKEIG